MLVGREREKKLSKFRFGDWPQNIEQWPLSPLANSARSLKKAPSIITNRPNLATRSVLWWQIITHTHTKKIQCKESESNSFLLAFYLRWHLQVQDDLLYWGKKANFWLFNPALSFSRAKTSQRFPRKLNCDVTEDYAQRQGNPEGGTKGAGFFFSCK